MQHKYPCARDKSHQDLCVDPWSFEYVKNVQRQFTTPYD